MTYIELFQPVSSISLSLVLGYLVKSLIINDLGPKFRCQGACYRDGHEEQRRHHRPVAPGPGPPGGAPPRFRAGGADAALLLLYPRREGGRAEGRAAGLRAGEDVRADGQARRLLPLC